MDWLTNASLVISISALVMSCLSPLLSALISGFFRRNEKKLELKAELERRDHEFYTQHRAEAIERYITAVGKLSRQGGKEPFFEYGAAMGEVYLYVDSQYWPLLDTIAEKLKRGLYLDVTPELEKLCKELAGEKIRSPHEEQPTGRHRRLPH